MSPSAKIDDEKRAWRRGEQAAEVRAIDVTKVAGQTLPRIVQVSGGRMTPGGALSGGSGSIRPMTYAATAELPAS